MGMVIGVYDYEDSQIKSWWGIHTHKNHEKNEREKKTRSIWMKNGPKKGLSGYL